MGTVTEGTALIGRLLPEPHAGLLAGILFGTKSQLPKDLYDAMITTGTIHIAVLSGMNIAILAGLVASVLVLVAGRRISTVVTALCIILFVGFVGPSASIVRAAIMGMLVLVSVLTGRPYWPLLSLAVTTAVMLLAVPSWISDSSFHLSVLATLGLLLFGSREYHVNAHSGGESDGIPVSFRSVFGTVRAWVITELRLTLAAQVFTVPLILLRFRRISLIAPIANLAIGWIIAPLTATGWITLAVAGCFLPAGRLIATADWLMLEYIIRTVRMLSSLPGAGIGW